MDSPSAWKNAQSYLAALAVFVAVMAASVVLHRNHLALQEKEEQLRLANIAHTQALLIDRNLARALDATYVLAQEVRRTHGEVENFESLADRLISAYGGISNLQLAPEAIVRRIHPLAGNEKALGHNLLRDDRRREEARTAIDTGLITLAGPFRLVQGGVAVVGRNPVFLESGGQQRFWGFVSALITIEDLFAGTGIPQLEREGYLCQLSYLSTDTHFEDRYPDVPLPSGYHSQSVSFSVPNSTWTLTVSAPRTEPIIDDVLYYVLWIAFALLLATAAHHLLRRPVILEEIVRQRTHELENANLRYKQLSETDPLTRIPNRRAYEDQVTEEVNAARRTRQALSMLMVDIDHFKGFNDHYGHDAGDIALRRVAEEIIDALPRSTDFAARFGGEEFVVLLPSTDIEGAHQVAERIRSRVRSLGIAHDYSDGIGTITVSVGIASLGGAALNEGDLLRQADAALYSAKKDGRNRCVVFDPARRSPDGEA